MSSIIIQNITRKFTKHLWHTTTTTVNGNQSAICSQNNCFLTANKRNLWGYVAVAFNQVDTHRLGKVGPNRLCAEWVVKNGGGVRFTSNPTVLWKDYNALPPESVKFRIKVVDATNASIMKIGLEHFKGCEDIDTVIFHNCKHLENDSLEGLKYLANSLNRLQVSGCYNIDDQGIMTVGDLVNLKQLLIFDMLYIKGMNEVVSKLQSRLPNCTIEATRGQAKFI